MVLEVAQEQPDHRYHVEHICDSWCKVCAQFYRTDSCAAGKDRSVVVIFDSFINHLFGFVWEGGSRKDKTSPAPFFITSGIFSSHILSCGGTIFESGNELFQASSSLVDICMSWTVLRTNSCMQQYACMYIYSILGH